MVPNSGSSRRVASFFAVRVAIPVAAWALALGAASPAAADTYLEVQGARSMAMGGAHRGIGNGNEALWLNPAGMALTRRYNIDVQYGYGGNDGLSYANLSAVDSKSGPVAGGLAYSRSWGEGLGANPNLNRIALGAAAAVGGVLGVGATGYTLRGSHTQDGVRDDDVNIYNGTVGVGMLLGEAIGLGVAYQNVLAGRDADAHLQPPSLGFGMALRGSSLSVAADASLDMRPAAHRRAAYHLGAEYFTMDALALRFGYRHGAVDPRRVGGAVGGYVSGGLGIITSGGALNASAERDLAGRGTWSAVGSLQFFM